MVLQICAPTPARFLLMNYIKPRVCPSFKWIFVAAAARQRTLKSPWRQWRQLTHARHGPKVRDRHFLSSGA